MKQDIHLSLSDLGSIPGRVIPKTLKMVLDTSLLNTQQYKVWIEGKVEQSWEGVVPSPTPWCSSYGKGSLLVALDYSCQHYFYLHCFLFKILKNKKKLVFSVKLKWNTIIYRYIHQYYHIYIYIYIYIIKIK